MLFLKHIKKQKRSHKYLICNMFIIRLLQSESISYQELIYKNWQEGLMGNKVRIRINTEYSYTEIAS